VQATEVLTSHGVRLGKAPSAMTIGAVATIRRIVHGGNFPPEYGAHLLTLTIRSLMLAFPTHDHESNVSRWDRDLLLAVSNLIASNPEYNPERLAEKMRIRPAIQWVNMGRQQAAPSWEVIATGIKTDYNRGLRKGRLG